MVTFKPIKGLETKQTVPASIGVLALCVCFHPFH